MDEKTNDGRSFEYCLKLTQEETETLLFCSKHSGFPVGDFLRMLIDDYHETIIMNRLLNRSE